MGQEFRSSLAGLFWLGIPHDVTVKCLLGMELSEGLTGAWEFTFRMAPSHWVCLHSTAWVFLPHGAWLSPAQVIQGTTMEAVMLLWVNLGRHTPSLFLWFLGPTGHFRISVGRTTWGCKYQEVMISGHIFEAGFHNQYYCLNSQEKKQKSEWLGLKGSRPHGECVAHI